MDLKSGISGGADGTLKLNYVLVLEVRLIVHGIELWLLEIDW